LKQNWSDIVRDFGPLVWRTARRLLRDHADAADCFQQTFVSALQLETREPVSNWPGLLQRIATARALDLLRKRMRHPTSDLEFADSVPSTLDDPVSMAQGAELGDRLREALATLPAQQSEVFCLRHLNELSYQEISTQLGMSIDAVGVTLHRARGRLREQLTAFAVVKRSES
jgi:RNA polymerase sigma-70 factor (ECF subfamily)